MPIDIARRLGCFIWLLVPITLVCLMWATTGIVEWALGCCCVGLVLLAVFGFGRHIGSRDTPDFPALNFASDFAFGCALFCVFMFFVVGTFCSLRDDIESKRDKEERQKQVEAEKAATLREFNLRRGTVHRIDQSFMYCATVTCEEYAEIEAGGIGKEMDRRIERILEGRDPAGSIEEMERIVAEESQTEGRELYG